MKKATVLVLLAAIILPLVSCASGDAPPQGKNVNEVLQNGAAAKDRPPVSDAGTGPVTSPAETAPASVSSDTAAKTDNYPSSDADVDLSLMSDLMVYSALYDIIAHAKDHLGETFRIKGTFAVYEGDGKTYFACLVTDATACCSQGLEFVLSDSSLVYPDDYPELGAEITVSGVFDTYQEGPYSYCQLIDAVIEN